MLWPADILSPTQLVFAVLAGGFVGILSGTFGVGGGFLIVPVLNIALGIPMEFAVGAGACQVLGPATTSILARRIDPAHLKLPLMITGGLLIGVFGGASALHSAQQSGDVALLGAEVMLADLVVLSVYFMLLSSVGLFAIWEVRRTVRGKTIRKGWLADFAIPPLIDAPEFNRPRVSVSVLAWFGLAVGFISGLLGMSGGLILLPGLIYLLGLRTHDAVVGSLIIVWIVALLATIVHAWNGFVVLPLVMALLAHWHKRIALSLSVLRG